MEYVDDKLLSILGRASSIKLLHSVCSCFQTDFVSIFSSIQDMSLSGNNLHPTTQPEFLTPDLTSELLSTMLPVMNDHQVGDKQGFFELPMNGMVM